MNLGQSSSDNGVNTMATILRTLSFSIELTIHTFPEVPAVILSSYFITIHLNQYKFTPPLSATHTHQNSNLVELSPNSQIRSSSKPHKEIAPLETEFFEDNLSNLHTDFPRSHSI